MGVWLETLDVKDIFCDDDLSLAQKRDIIVDRARKLELYDDDLEMILDEFEEVEDVIYFDLVWEAVYDWADDRRVWVATF